jgi:hypothetical protein
MGLKAQDLRVGNLFYPINRKNNIHLVDEMPFIIMEVTQINVKAHLLSKQTHQVLKYDEFSIRDISPIPITEYILLKCGFRKDEDINYRYYYKQILAYDLDDNCIRIIDSWEFGKINFIHELQNLIFALTKTELEITL